MREYEFIIKALDLPAHFAKHPPITDGHGHWNSRNLRALIVNSVSCPELNLLQHRAVAKDFTGVIVPDSNEANAYSEAVTALWLDLERLEDRTFDEGRMEPAKLYALQDDETKTVYDVMKVLRDLEKGARSAQSGMSAKIDKLLKENKKLKAALQTAQIELAAKISKN